MPGIDHLYAAKLWAIDKRPYFAAALSALIHVEKPGIGTLAVDEYYRLYYDPAVFEKWTVPLTGAVLIHEISHLLREHHSRARAMDAGLDPFVWNIAGDMEINDDLAIERMTLPPNCVYPSTFKQEDGELVETYYQAIIKEADKAREAAGSSQVGEGQADPSKSMCGSGATGQRQSWDLGGGKDVAPGLNQAEANLVGRQVANEIQEAINKGRGSIAGGWKRWAKDKLKSKVNYSAMIRAAVRGGVADAEGKSDYSYKRPNRRQSTFGKVIMPGLRGPRPRIGMGIDTSGSMSDKQLSQCMAEVKSALNQSGYNTGIYVASCDVACQPVKQIFNINKIDLVGGGGTDMGEAIRTLDAVRPRLGIMILLTDCETGWPEQPPAIPLVIIKVAGSGAPPPWKCRLIEIDLSEY